MKKIIKNDLVVVITGKDKGKQGRVLNVLGDMAIVEGVKEVKRHQKPNSMRGIEGGIVIKSMPISISNIAIFNPETNKPDRVGIQITKEADKIKRVRVFKSTGLPISV